MIARKIFLRSVRARDQLDVFLVSAVSSLLIVRFYLQLAGFPRLGGGNLHIAHMLYGGILMMVAITLSLAFIGARIHRLTAVIGGIGFGIFIDELGKFITNDNNYFFHPTIGLIYGIFIVLYLGFTLLGRTEKLSSQEYQLNALGQMEEAIIRDMDPFEKKRVARLLSKADQANPFTVILQKFLDEVQTVPGQDPRFVRALIKRISRTYRRFWGLRKSNQLVRVFFVFEAGLFLVGIIVTIYNNFDQVRDVVTGHTPLYSSQLLVGQLVASGLATAFAVAGAVLLTKSRFLAFEQFRRATLINLFLTEFFIFSRIQLAAVPGFLFNLALLGLINYALYEEKARE